MTTSSELSTAATAAEAAGGVRRAALSSAAWTLFGFGTMQVLRLGANIVLNWLLFPELLGLMTTVNVFIQGLHMFSDVGIGPAIVRSHRGDDPVFLNTAWTLQVGRGLTLWVCSALIAWPASVLYSRPELLWLIPVAGITAAINGFNATAVFTLNRKLAQARLVLLQLVTYICSMTITITYVLWIERSIWALVLGGVISSVLEMTFSHLFLPGQPSRLRWDAPSARDLLSFGKWIFIGTACTFLADYVDRLVVGKISMATLGIYQNAAQLVAIPVLVMIALGPQVVFPLYSRLYQSGHKLDSVFPRLHPAATCFAAVLISGLMATGPTAVQIMYDRRYAAAGWMLQFLAVGAWFRILEMTAGSILWTLGKAQISALSNASKVIGLLVFAPLGFWLYGFPGMLVGFIASDLVRYALTCRAVRQEGLNPLRFDLPLTGLLLAIGLAVPFIVDQVWTAAPKAEWFALLGMSPEGSFPGTISWGGLILSAKRNWSNLLGRLLLEAVVVLAVWGVFLLLCWYRGIVHDIWKLVGESRSGK